MPAATLDRLSKLLLVLSWGLVVAGVLWLVVLYGRLPEQVGLYRPPWQPNPVLGPKSITNVFRLPLMGVGQLGAAMAMLFASTASRGWRRFWRWLALAVSVKTFFTCVGFAMRAGSRAEQTMNEASFVPVVLFGAAALWWWRGRQLGKHPALTAGTRLGVFVSLMIWAFAALAPRWL